MLVVVVAAVNQNTIPTTSLKVSQVVVLRRRQVLLARVNRRRPPPQKVLPEALRHQHLGQLQNPGLQDLLHISLVPRPVLTLFLSPVMI